MRPQTHTIRLLIGLFNESPVSFTLASYLQKFRIGSDITEAKLELQKAVHYGLLLETTDKVTYQFSESFYEATEAERDRMGLYSSPSAPTPEIYTPSSSPPVQSKFQPYTAITVSPSAADDEMLYYLHHVAAKNPKHVLSALKKKLKDIVWHHVVTFAGTHHDLDPNTTSPAPPPFVWVEYDSQGLSNVLSSDIPNVAWIDIDWDALSDHINWTEFEAEEPDTAANVKDFQLWCQQNNYEHQIGIDILQHLIDHPYAPFEEYIGVEEHFDQDTDHPGRSELEGPTDEELDEMEREDFLAAYRGLD